MKFKVQRYELYETTITADTPEEAAVLLKYKAFRPSGWQNIGNPTYKLLNPDNKVIQIDDTNYKS
jgi:hypothetical protein